MFSSLRPSLQITVYTDYSSTNPPYSRDRERDSEKLLQVPRPSYMHTSHPHALTRHPSPCPPHSLSPVMIGHMCVWRTCSLPGSSGTIDWAWLTLPVKSRTTQEESAPLVRFTHLSLPSHYHSSPPHPSLLTPHPSLFTSLLPSSHSPSQMLIETEMMKQPMSVSPPTSMSATVCCC